MIILTIAASMSESVVMPAFSSSPSAEAGAGGSSGRAGCVGVFVFFASGVILSDTDATFDFLAAVFYQCLFQTTVRKTDASPGQRLDREMHCFLDEFANIGKIPAFPTLIATIRSRGISASIVIQNLAQLKALYKEQWETIAGNCDSTLFLGGNEETTTK